MTVSSMRAAFDLGSGKFKVTVEEIQAGRSIRKVFTQKHLHTLGEDVAANGVFSASSQKTAQRILLELKNAAQEHGAKEFCGIATAVFRVAKNGQSFISKLQRVSQIPLRIISQKEEAILGFEAVVSNCQELPASTMITWDSGNSSFQLTKKEKTGYVVFEGPMGNSTVAKLLIEKVRMQKYTKDAKVNPVSLKEMEELVDVVKAAMSEDKHFACLVEKTVHKEGGVVVRTGGINGLPGIPLETLDAQNPTVTVATIKDAIKRLAGQKNESEILQTVSMDDRERALPKMALLQAVMEKLRIPKLRLGKTQGISEGLLISEKYWKRHAPFQPHLVPTSYFLDHARKRRFFTN